MKIQFCHARKYKGNDACECCGFSNNREISATGGMTIAMEELPKWVLLSLQEGDFFEKKIGYAVCSDEDNYNKKIGRNLASSRMKLKKLHVSKIIKVNNVMVHLRDQEGNVYTIIGVPNSDKARFVHYKHHSED